MVDEGTPEAAMVASGDELGWGEEEPTTGQGGQGGRGRGRGRGRGTMLILWLCYYVPSRSLSLLLQLLMWICRSMLFCKFASFRLPCCRMSFTRVLITLLSYSPEFSALARRSATFRSTCSLLALLRQQRVYQGFEADPVEK